MGYRDFKDLNRRIASDKVLYDKALILLRNPTCNGYPRRLASVVYRFSDKKTWATTRAIKNGPMSNNELVEELEKIIIRKFKKRKLHSSFKDNNCGTDLAHIQLISKLN